MISSSNKNPYDFESEEEGEIRETPTNDGNRTTDVSNDDQQMKKKIGKKPNPTAVKKRVNLLEEEHIHRVPPLKIVLARTTFPRPNEMER